MDIVNDFKFIFINLFLLIIWFKTEAIYEYCKYIPLLNKLFKFKEFQQFRCIQDEIYPNFLVIKYNNFFTRLISCPKCINFWITLILIFFINSFFSLFIIYTLSLMLYNIYTILENYARTSDK
jgi:hypothetical protein